MMPVLGTHGTGRWGRGAAAVVAAWSLLVSGCGEDQAGGVLEVSRVIGETGRQAGQFLYPRGMDHAEIGGRTLLVVVDKTARIQLIDLKTGASVGSLRTPEFDLGMPTGLTVAPFPGEPGTPAVWVADTHEHRVIVYRLPFDHDGEPTEPDLAFGSYGYEPGQFIYPTDIAVRLDDGGRIGEVFVSEYGGNDRIQVFRFDEGRAVFDRQIGISGVAMDAPEDDPAALARPQSVVLRGGELVVSDAGRHRVVRFDAASGSVLGWTDGAELLGGGPAEPLRFPYGLCLIDDRTALVSEFGGSRLRLIDLDSGRTVRLIGTPGRGVGETATPWAGEVVGDELVILDSGNDRIQVAPWSGVGR
jgi:hypothetical protein